VIAAAGDKLWKELIGSTDPKGPSSLNITNVQLSFTGLEATAVNQKNIEGFFRPPSSSDAESSRSARPELKRKRSSSPAPPPQSSSPSDENPPEDAQFVCPRCGKSMAVPKDLQGPGIEATLRSDALLAIRMYVACSAVSFARM
jgi:DNA polymerase eta